MGACCACEGKVTNSQLYGLPHRLPQLEDGTYRQKELQLRCSKCWKRDGCSHMSYSAKSGHYCAYCGCTWEMMTRFARFGDSVYVCCSGIQYTYTSYALTDAEMCRLFGPKEGTTCQCKDAEGRIGAHNCTQCRGTGFLLCCYGTGSVYNPKTGERKDCTSCTAIDRRTYPSLNWRGTRCRLCTINADPDAATTADIAVTLKEKWLDADVRQPKKTATLTIKPATTEVAPFDARSKMSISYPDPDPPSEAEDSKPPPQAQDVKHSG